MKKKYYCKPVTVGNFWRNNCIEDESNSGRNKKSDKSKTQLTISNNFISSRDNDEERVMHSKSNNIEITINNKTD